MTVASIQGAISYRSLFLIPVAVAVGMILLNRGMRRLALRPQFMVLLVLGVSIGFIFLVILRMPELPRCRGANLLGIGFRVSFLGVSSCRRSSAQIEQDECTSF